MFRAVYSERFTLPFISEVLIAAAERRRPGLGPWTPAVRAQLREIFQAELAEVKARFFELFDDRAYWDKLERAVLDDAFVRYAAVAERHTALEARGYGIWRGGDVVSRVVLGLGGLAVGAFIARAPFIPLPTSADVVVMLSALGTPLLPDLQVWLHERRFRRQLKKIVEDMATAQEQQKLYQPLPTAFGLEPISPVESGGVATEKRKKTQHS